MAKEEISVRDERAEDHQGRNLRRGREIPKTVANRPKAYLILGKGVGGGGGWNQRATKQDEGSGPEKKRRWGHPRVRHITGATIDKTAGQAARGWGEKWQAGHQW